MSEVSVTRTRRSLAEQLREALDTMAERGQIRRWESHYGRDDSGKAYTVDHFSCAFGRLVYDFTPGECMDFVNEYGYDVAIGKP